MTQEKIEKKQKFEREELRLIYSEALSDLRLWKNQQWLITTYILGIFTALITIWDKLLDTSHLPEFRSIIILCFALSLIKMVSIAVVIGGVWILHTYSKNIKTSRSLKEEIIFKYDPVFRNLLKIDDKKINYDVTGLILKIIIIIGGIAVILYCFARLIVLNF